MIQAIAIVTMAAFKNNDHGQELNCQLAPYSPMLLKVAWGGGQPHFSSHDPHMVLSE